MEKEISQAVIRRMPRYYRYLGELLESGIERISSRELSVLMHVTASQIRQDLNNFGGFGQTGYGYNVSFLHDEIGRILGLKNVNDIIVVGVGNLGRAIANYIIAGDEAFSLIGLFDLDKQKKGETVCGIPIMHTDELKDFCTSRKVDIAVLSMPKENAPSVAAELISYGIKGFWNFAHVDIDTPSGVAVENVHLSESLMNLSYEMTGGGV
ncbi:MAG: redox-sensing transcriptional repressor Rex [Lachnospiraceae bacterium]|nr:redox-sensing transcriptional repressor Rex [Lachnospiraceae bacterium]